MIIFSINSNEAIEYMYRPVCSLLNTQNVCEMNHRFNYKSETIKFLEKNRKTSSFLHSSRTQKTNSSSGRWRVVTLWRMWIRKEQRC